MRKVSHLALEVDKLRDEVHYLQKRLSRHLLIDEFKASPPIQVVIFKEWTKTPRFSTKTLFFIFKEERFELQEWEEVAGRIFGVPYTVEAETPYIAIWRWKGYQKS